MSLQTVARRYAAALADVAIERREEREVQNELDQWAAMIESNPQLKEVFANPTVAYDQKRKVLEELISRTRVQRNNRELPARLVEKPAPLPVARSGGAVMVKYSTSVRGVVAANVTTARPIPEELKKHASRDARGCDWPKGAPELYYRRNDHRWFGRAHRLNDLRRISAKSARAIVGRIWQVAESCKCASF